MFRSFRVLRKGGQHYVVTDNQVTITDGRTEKRLCTCKKEEKRRTAHCVLSEALYFFYFPFKTPTCVAGSPLGRQPEHRQRYHANQLRVNHLNLIHGDITHVTK